MAIEKITNDFRYRFQLWCGFSLESDNIDDAILEVRQRQSDLVSEAHQQAKSFERELKP